MTWMVLEFSWKRLPRVTVPSRMAFWGGECMSSSSPPGHCFIVSVRFLSLAGQTMGEGRRWYSVHRRWMDDLSFSRFSVPYLDFYCYSTTCQIGISMATKDLTWGILTSGLVSMFFYRHVAPDINGDPHHILSCSELVYIDAARPSLFSLCVATLLGAEDPHALDPRPVSVSITLQPYRLPATASASKATCSNIGRHRGSRNHPKSTQTPRGSTSRDVFPPQMSHGRQPLHPMKISRTLPGVRKVATLVYRVGVRGPSLWKVFLFSNSSSYHLT